MWVRGVLPTALPAPHSTTLSPPRPICVYVEPQGLLVVRLPAPIVPHSASLGPASATQVLSAPVSVSTPPVPVWMNVYFLFPWCRTPLLFDSLSVLVVRGGAVCLPTPLSWFSEFVFKLIFLQLSYYVLGSIYRRSVTGLKSISFFFF